MKIILATSSPFRVNAFKKLGIEFESCDSQVDEKFANRPKDPRRLVLELSKRKALAVAEKYSSGVVIGFDSIAFCNREILEKPRNHAEAKKRFLKISGKKFQFFTGLYVKNLDSGKVIRKVVETEGRMRKITPQEVDFYHKQDKNGIKYAFGFDPKFNFSSIFVKEIKGSYHNFLDGIPLEEIYEILAKMGLKVKEPKSKLKITLSGSVKFADKLVEIFKELEKEGHIPLMHEEMFRIADGTAKELIEGIHKDHAQIKRENNFIKWWHDCIVSGDALLVCNYDKKGIKNYIGGNTLMEIGFAHVNNKKVFLLNPVPEEMPYADEIKAMVDEIINGNLKKIK